MSETPAKKMREYVDGIQGAGSWDRMHDLVDKRQLSGWTMPPLEVDGRKVSIFPGTDREGTVEAVQSEIRRAFEQHRYSGMLGRVAHEDRGDSDLIPVYRTSPVDENGMVKR